MTSSINPLNINGAYPIAGQDNDSQGFRDNFTNIRNNFTETAAEITALQNTAVFTGNVVNNMAGSTIYGATTLGVVETSREYPTITSPMTIDFGTGAMHKLDFTTNTAVTLNFVWTGVPSGAYAKMRVWASIPAGAANSTISFTSVTVGANIAGLTGTPPTTPQLSAGDYIYEFSTMNIGTDVVVVKLV